jgi:hypothetical protein
LTDLTERAELLRQTSAKVGAVYGEFEGALGNAVQGAQDGRPGVPALTVSADAATVAVTSAKTNVERFGRQLAQLGDLTAGFEKFPQETVTIIAALSSLRTNLGEANRALGGSSGGDRWREQVDCESRSRPVHARARNAGGGAIGPELERRLGEGECGLGGAERNRRTSGAPR